MKYIYAVFEFKNPDGQSFNIKSTFKTEKPLTYFNLMDHAKGLTPHPFLNVISFTELTKEVYSSFWDADTASTS